jgi:hypothetical protein
LAVDPVGVLRSYEIVSTRGTRGNLYQRLLAFTTARRKAPAVLLDAVLKRYGVGRRVRRLRASDDSPGDGARPVECVTLTLPGEPPAARLADAATARWTSTLRSAGPRRP